MAGLEACPHPFPLPLLEEQALPGRLDPARPGWWAPAPAPPPGLRPPSPPQRPPSALPPGQWSIGTLRVEAGNHGITELRNLNERGCSGRGRREAGSVIGVQPCTVGREGRAPLPLHAGFPQGSFPAGDNNLLSVCCLFAFSIPSAHPTPPKQTLISHMHFQDEGSTSVRDGRGALIPGGRILVQKSRAV